MAVSDDLPDKNDKTLLAQQIYAVLLRKLTTNELAPGTKLNIDGMSKKLGVSRSPVAAAFSALERDGFLKIVPKNGTFVRDFTREELQGIFMARSALERVVASFGVRKASEESLLEMREKLEKIGQKKKYVDADLLTCFDLELEMHRFLSEFLPDIVRREYNIISNLTMRSRLITLKMETEKYSVAELIQRDVRIHVAILDAFLARNTERAARLLERDSRQSKRNTINHLY